VAYGRSSRAVLIAGAGVAALETLLALRHLAGPRVRVDLLAPKAEFVLRPFSVVEPFGGQAPPRLALGPLVRDHGAGHVFDGLAAVEPERHVARGSSGEAYAYDALVVAIGARSVDALPGALTFPGPGATTGYGGLLEELEDGRVRELVFALPAGVAWGLPLYELALLTAAWLFEHRIGGVRLTLATPEPAPLAAFGGPASTTVAELLERHGVHVRCEVVPAGVEASGLRLESGETLAAGRVVALARPSGPALPGLPADPEGFVPVDAHGRVPGAGDVYAAGDVTTWPMKQGGLAAQQADAVAESVAAWAGAAVRPAAFRPVLRGVLLTGERPAFLRADPRPHEAHSVARLTPLWWPPAKVAGRHLAPYLAAHGIAVPSASAVT
jgi:sulfide:quinone oxidoreductase